MLSPKGFVHLLFLKSFIYSVKGILSRHLATCYWGTEEHQICKDAPGGGEHRRADHKDCRDQRGCGLVSHLAVYPRQLVFFVTFDPSIYLKRYYPGNFDEWNLKIMVFHREPPFPKTSFSSFHVWGVYASSYFFLFAHIDISTPSTKCPKLSYRIHTHRIYV